MHNTEENAVHAYTCLILAMVCFGAVPLFLRYFTASADAWTINGFRYGVAVVFWIIPLGFQLLTHQVPLRVFRLALVPSLLNIISQTLFAWVPYYLEPGMMTFITRSSILFSVMIALIVFDDERWLVRVPAFWLGCVMTLSGVTGLSLAGDGLAAETHWFGILLAVLCSLGIAGYGASVRYYMKGIVPWVSFPVISFYTTWGLLILMLLFGQPHDLNRMGAPDLMLLTISAIIGIALGHVFFYYAIAKLGIALSSGMMQVLPFGTTLGSYLIFGEQLNLWQWVFGLAILSGALTLVRVQTRSRQQLPTVSPTPSPSASSGAKTIASPSE